MVGGHLPKKIYVFLIMMKYDDLYFASRYNFFTDCVEWYFLPKTEIKVFLKKMDIRDFGWRPSLCICLSTLMLLTYYLLFSCVKYTIIIVTVIVIVITSQQSHCDVIEDLIICMVHLHNYANGVRLYYRLRLDRFN